MAMTKKAWTVSALESELPPTRRTLAKYLAEVEPCKVKGKVKSYWLADVLRAMPPSLLGIGPVDADALNLNDESARLKKHQADKTELEVKERKKELIPAEVVGAVWMDMVVKFRSKVLSLPSVAASQVSGVDAREAKKILDGLVTQILDELKEYEPTDYSS